MPSYDAAQPANLFDATGLRTVGGKHHLPHPTCGCLHCTIERARVELSREEREQRVRRLLGWPARTR